MKQHLNTIVITLGVIFAGYLLADGYRSRGKVADSISVTGLGEESFTSDLIVWRGSFSRKDYELKAAYAALNRDQRTIKNYLTGKGVQAEDVIFEAVDIQKDYAYEYGPDGTLRSSVFNGYNLSQVVKVQSKNVDVVEDISRKVTELIDAGVELTSFAPEYYYTKLAQLKVKMIEAATKDARNRAEKIAENAGGSLGGLKNADMGVFQITGENSSEDYSWGGSFNTSSKRKTANITIRLRYEID
ncbi:MAG: SIMPL domain-containing protein [Cryomorphaceae bacterium]|jgi:hypothetical protein|nr:SIMPL domain-containing protein [Cryomorphaceae bacterium]